MRRFPPPWTVEKIASGFRVLDANQQSLAYVYAGDARITNPLTEDEARRIAANIAKLPAGQSDGGLTSPGVTRARTGISETAVTSLHLPIATCVACVSVALPAWRRCRAERRQGTRESVTY
jgi:hypothetical protein